MYIQPQADAPTSGIYLPRDYSGNAFAPQKEPLPNSEEDLPQAEKTQSVQTPTEAQASCEMEPRAECEAEPLQQKDVETGMFSKEASGSGCNEERRGQGFGGLLGKLPFLSSLLPPARHYKEENAQGLFSGGGRDLLLLGAMAYLLFFDQSDDGILPLLLLLLLWE